MQVGGPRRSVDVEPPLPQERPAAAWVQDRLSLTVAPLTCPVGTQAPSSACRRGPGAAGGGRGEGVDVWCL